MKKVKYIGIDTSTLTTLNIEVKQGDIIDVPDDFLNSLFEEVTIDTNTKKKGDNQ